MLVCLGIVASLLAVSRPGVAATSVAKRASIDLTGSHLRATVGFREMFTEQLRDRLHDGFSTHVVMQVVVYSQTQRKVVASTVRTIKATYDLWEERFLVRYDDWRGTRHRKYTSERDVIDRLTSLWRFEVCAMAALKNGERYTVGVYSEVNPLKPEVISEVRRWLRKPTRRQRIGNDSFFGSFVGIFINEKVSRAEQTFRIESQPFTLP